jgi:hypothetical protein
MRIPLVMLALVGCGSAAPPAASSVGNKLPPKADVRGSRDALLRETVSLLAAGDANALLALADLEEAITRSVECTGPDADSSKDAIESQVRKLRETVAVAAVRAKGHALEIIEIEPGHASTVGKAGDKQGGCTLRAGLTYERVKLKLRVDGKPSTIRIELMNIADRFYVVDVSRQIVPDTSASEAMGYFQAHVERICACKDHNCVTAATEDYGKMMAEWARENAGRTAEAPSEEDKRMMEEVSNKMTDCLTKMSAKGNP